MSLDVATYLTWARGQNIPPLCLELVMRSGKSYWVKNVLDHAPREGLFAVRVWDLRALGAEEIGELTARMNLLRDRAMMSLPQDLHPSLDQANVWLNVADIEHLVEWHDRIWPEPTIELAQRKQIGFVAPTTNEESAPRS